MKNEETWRWKRQLAQVLCKLYRAEYRDEIYERLSAAVEPQRPDMSNPSMQTVGDPTLSRLERTEQINETPKGRLVRAVDVQMHRLSERYTEDFADSVFQAVIDGRNYKPYHDMDRPTFVVYKTDFERTVIKESGY